MVVYTAVEVESLPSKAATVVVVFHDDLRPSQSMNHMFFPEVDHMHDRL